MATETKEIVRTTIDLPNELNEKLLQKCELSKRSRHAEILFILEKSFAPEQNANGKKEKTK